MNSLETVVCQINKILHSVPLITYSPEHGSTEWKQLASLLDNAARSWSNDLYRRLFGKYSDALKTANASQISFALKDAEHLTVSLKDKGFIALVHESETLWRTYQTVHQVAIEQLSHDKKSSLKLIASLLDVIEKENAA